MLTVAIISIGIPVTIIAIISFIGYGRARMREQEAREKRLLKLHYSMLFILLILGIVYMFFMVDKGE